MNIEIKDDLKKGDLISFKEEWLEGGTYERSINKSGIGDHIDGVAENDYKKGTIIKI